MTARKTTAQFKAELSRVNPDIEVWARMGTAARQFARRLGMPGVQSKVECQQAPQDGRPVSGGIDEGQPVNLSAVGI